MSANKQHTKASSVDPDEVPELTEEYFERADYYIGDKLVRKGKPLSGHAKVLLSVRYDADIVEAFRATGKGWQTRMNDALREWLKSRPAP